MVTVGLTGSPRRSRITPVEAWPDFAQGENDAYGWSWRSRSAALVANSARSGVLDELTVHQGPAGVPCNALVFSQSASPVGEPSRAYRRYWPSPHHRKAVIHRKAHVAELLYAAGH